MKPTITTQQYISCLELVEMYPNNEYWENRLQEARVEFDESAGVDVDAFLLVMDALKGTLPEYHDLLTMAYMEHSDISQEPVDWPWTDDDMRDELMNRYPDR